MPRGKVTISIDLELAWGYWDQLTPNIVRMAATEERHICAELLELFDRYQIPATWATVAAVLDGASARDRPGEERAWYAPDIVEHVVKARVGHEIGSHSGRHILYDRGAEADVQADIDFAKAVHRKNALTFESFVFPRNCVGHLELLARSGIRVVRGPDTGWVRAAGHLPPVFGRVITFADKILPIPPVPARAEQHGSLTDIPGSMLLPGRNGLRRLIAPAANRVKLAMGLARAQRDGSTFHLWFHPSNFYYRRDERLATLEWFLARAADEASKGNLEIWTMRDYASAEVKVSA
jgi:hypothetical protein